MAGEYPSSTPSFNLVRHGYLPVRMEYREGVGKWHLGWDWGYPQNAQNKKDVDFSLPIKNGPTERGFDYFYGIPSSLDIAPYVYVENNKVTALPNHIIEPQKGLKLMHGGVAGAVMGKYKKKGFLLFFCLLI